MCRSLAGTRLRFAKLSNAGPERELGYRFMPSWPFFSLLPLSMSAGIVGCSVTRILHPTDTCFIPDETSLLNCGASAAVGN